MTTSSTRICPRCDKLSNSTKNYGLFSATISSHRTLLSAESQLPDAKINEHEALLNDDTIATYTPLRRANSRASILHASVSCKWTIRSDRSQNARTEGLNLVRNRKGKTPHIVVVIGEPLPGRIASLAYGTGDIDCIYHFALRELKAAVADNDSDAELLETLVTGRRLRDISDLPFDLAI